MSQPDSFVLSKNYSSYLPTWLYGMNDRHNKYCLDDVMFTILIMVFVTGSSVELGHDVWDLSKLHKGMSQRKDASRLLSLGHNGKGH